MTKTMTLEKPEEMATHPGAEPSTSHDNGGIPPAVPPTETDASDPYADAIEKLFAAYQEFQENMFGMAKKVKPRDMYQALVNATTAFQKAIADFREAEFEVPTDYQKGHDFVLSGIAKYSEFLEDYPATLRQKASRNTMKKVTALGKLSAEADQDMKQAFRAFDEATQGV